MRIVLGSVMAANAALFLFGALLHAGVAVGPLAEPTIVPATVVEAVCGLFLAWGAVSLFTSSSKRQQAALTGNLVALGGVSLGIIALTTGHGPHKLDPLHIPMLGLIAVSLGLLFADRSSRRPISPARMGS